MPIGTINNDPSVTPFPNALSFSPFNLTTTVSSGYSLGEISTVTITKTPTSMGGAGTSNAYISLNVTGSGITQNFLNSDTITFNFSTGSSQVEFTFAGKYSDYMFPSQRIKYYDNPTNIAIGNTSPNIRPVLNVNVNSGNPNAYSFVGYETTTVSTASTFVSPEPYYHEVQTWAQLPKENGAYKVDSLYEFVPGEGTSTYFTYTFNITTTGIGLGSGNTNEQTSTTHTVEYNLDYAKEQFFQVLDNQRF